VNCAGESVRDIPLPVFCVDSPTWRSSSETAQELAALHAFVVTLNPLPTESLVAPNPKWYKIEIETEANVLVSAREELLPNGMVQIVRLQDRERQRLTDYDGTTITFSEWREIRAWEETRTFTVAVETVTELIPPEGSGVSTDGCARYRTKQRANTTRFDGSVLYGEWTTIHEWEEAEEVPGEQRARARHTSSAGPVTPDDIELRHT
jgi:hypothetical protein